MCPVDFLHRVLGYAGYWGIWGITWVLKMTGAAAFSVVGSEDLPHAEVVLMQILKAALMAGGLAVAWLQRKGNIWVALALVWALFMVFASGVAAQYLIWPMALLFVAAPRWWLVAEAGNAVFLFVFYTVLCGGLPWYYGEANAVVNERWLPWTCVAWGAWIVCLCALARHARTASLGAPCSISASSAKIPTT
jgi:hypothetical protein